MATTYNHAQIGIVDASGNVNVIYPITTGADVSITRTNTKLPTTATTAQKLADSLGKLAFLDSQINDSATSTTSTWSSNLINTKLTELNSKASKINTYVGTDGKLHFTNSAGADTVLPFNKGEITSGEAWCKSMEHYRTTYGGDLNYFDMDFTNIKSFTIALVNPKSYEVSYRHYIKLYDLNGTVLKDITITTTPVTFSDANILTKAKYLRLYYPNATDYSFSYKTK